MTTRDPLRVLHADDLPVQPDPAFAAQRSTVMTAKFPTTKPPYEPVETLSTTAACAESVAKNPMYDPPLLQRAMRARAVFPRTITP